MGYVQVPRTADESVRDAEILRSGVLFLKPDARLTQIVERVHVRFRTAMAALTIIHGEWQHVLAAVGITPGTYPRSTSFCGYTILDPGSVLCIPDAWADARTADHPNVIGGDRIRFYAGSPLLSNGVALGALCVFDRVPRDALAPDEERELQALAADAMAMVKDAARIARA